MTDIDFASLTKQAIEAGLEHLERIILRALNTAKVNGDGERVLVIQDHLRRFYERHL